MSAEHWRPLVAFFLVAVACALIVGQGLPSGDIFPFIGKSASTPAAVAPVLTIEPQPDRAADPGTPAAPTVTAPESPGSSGDVASTGGGTGSAQAAVSGAASTARADAHATGRRNDGANAPVRVPVSGRSSHTDGDSRQDLPGNSEQAPGRASVGTGASARTGETAERPGKAAGHGDRGRHAGKGHHRGQGKDQGQGQGKGQGQGHQRRD